MGRYFIFIGVGGVALLLVGIGLFCNFNSNDNSEEGIENIPLRFQKVDSLVFIGNGNSEIDSYILLDTETNIEYLYITGTWHNSPAVTRLWEE